jgi:hypothetical protein
MQRRRHTTKSPGSRLSASAVSCALVLAACASSDWKSHKPRVSIEALERVCFTDRVTASMTKGATLECYLVLPGQDAAAVSADAFSRPGETVWSRISDTDPVRHHELRPTPVAIVQGFDGEDSTGSARFEFDAERRLVAGSLRGGTGISWRWAADGMSLSQIDLAWEGRQLSIASRPPVAFGVRLSLQGGRTWESTVSVEAGTPTVAQEAYVSDGVFELPAPPRRAPPGLFPMCPLVDKERWEEWNGTFPRRHICLREERPWLILERDDSGRIVRIEDRLSPELRRVLSFTWHDGRDVPFRITAGLESDGETSVRADSVEMKFTGNGMPTVTRHRTRGEVSGLSVSWERMRADEAFYFDEGRARELELETRWSSEKRKSQMPELRFGLTPEPSEGPARAPTQGTPQAPSDDGSVPETP